MSQYKPRVILVGPAGAGKTTLGLALAQLLDLPLIQSDEWIKQHAHASIEQLIITQDPDVQLWQRLAGLALLGQEKLEHDWIAELGASLPLDREVFQALACARKQGSLVVEMTIPLAEASKRLGFNQPHQVSLGAPRAQLHRMMNQLHEQVASLADLTLEGTGNAGVQARQVVEAL